MRAGDDFELFLLQLGGQHREGRKMFTAWSAGVMEPQHLAGQGQGAAVRDPRSGILPQHQKYARDKCGR